MRKFFASLLAFLAFASVAYAQTVPNAPIVSGTVWTPDQWVAAWQSKQDTLGFTPMNGTNNLSEITNAASARSTLGLGTVSTLNTGTSGGNVCLPNANCTYSALQTFNNGISTTSITGTADLSTLTATAAFASVSATMANRFARQISVLDFDASACSSSSYDSTNAFYLASAWMFAHGPGVINVPAGHCKIGNASHPVLNLNQGTSLRGAGTSATFLEAGQANPAPLIQMQGQGNIIENVNINCGAVSQPTTGVCVQWGTPGTTPTIFANQYLSNVLISNVCVGADINGNQVGMFNVYINNTAGTGCGGIRVGSLTTGGNTVALWLINTVVASSQTTRADYDLELLDSGGGYVLNANFLYAKNGTMITPGANQYVMWTTFAHSALGDTNGNYAMYANTGASTAHILGNRFDSDWWASNASGDLILLNNTNGGQFTDMDFSNMYASNTPGYGFVMGANINNVSIGGASKICAYAFSGILLQSGATTFHLNGSTVTPTCMGHNLGGSYAIAFAGSNNNILDITGNDFTGNTANSPVYGTLDGLSTVVFSNNIPFDNNSATLTSGAFSSGALDLTLGGSISQFFPSFYYNGSSGISITKLTHAGWQGRTFQIINISGGNINVGGGTGVGSIQSPVRTVADHDYVTCYYTGAFALCH